MKKNFFKIICISIICLLTLSSCSLLEIIGDIIDDAMGGGSNDPINQLTSEDYQYDENLNDVDLVIEEDKAGHNTSIKDFREKTGIKVFPSTGEQKLLVIPVYFSDFPLNKCSITDPEEARKNIYKAFFGSSVKSNDENMTGWESVSSFYEKSSYGKLKITGEVAPWYAVNSTLMQAAQNGQKGDPSIKILRDAVDNYKKTNFAEISNYDSDKDGYIDGVVIVYANPYYSNNESFYSKYATTESQKSALKEFCWAYTYWDQTQNHNIISPNANVYMFASYSFMWDGGFTEQGSIFDLNKKKLVDAHTYIHEFGHVLGLDDYYSYDKDKTSPVGRLDMMDFNIGDHNAYSKYLLGWIEPTLITKEGTYDLNSFAETGEALLIPASLTDYCYSAFDEYILVELYTPTVNFEFDSKNKYMGLSSNYPYFYTKVGVRMFHVDSRMIVYNRATGKYSFSKTADISSAYQRISIAASNTPSKSISSDYHLINLISQRRTKTYFSSNEYANNNDLFYDGDILFSYNFDNGSKLDYRISVLDLDSHNKKSTIQFEKKTTNS